MKKQKKVEKKYFFGSKLQRKSTFESKVKEELAEEMEMLKADMKVELKEQLKKELRQELLEDLKLQMEAALSKEFGHEKELLRKIKMCFLSNDNDSERHEETDSQSQDSVSLLERCGYP